MAQPNGRPRTPTPGVCRKPSKQRFLSNPPTGLCGNRQYQGLPRSPAYSQRDDGGGKKKKKKTSLKACMASLHPRPCLTSEGPMPRAPQTRDVATHRTRPRQSRVHRPATRCALRNRNARGSSQWRSPSSHSFRATPPRRPACNRWRRWGECISTNLAGAGLRSVARNNKATRLLTRPGQATKSSAKDLSLRIVKLQFASWRHRFPRSPRCRPARILGQRPIRIRLRCAGENHPFLAWILT